MARVTILMYPESGHILPTLRIVQSLVGQHHSVTYVTVPLFEPLLTPLGCRVRHVFGDLTTRNVKGQQVTETEWLPPLTGLDLWRRVAEQHGTSTSSVRSTVRAAAADVLVPAIVATHPDLVLCDSKIIAACGDIIRGACDAVVIGLRTELPIGDQIDCTEIILCPDALELPPFRQETEGRFYCEPSVFTKRPDTATSGRTLRDDSKRLVYCSLGTQAASYEPAARVIASVVESLAGRPGWRLVIAAGEYQSHPLLLQRRAANVIIERTVNQLSVLSQASVAVLHGGLGGIKECILARVPMLIIPFIFDQPANAERVAFHGLGRFCLPQDCTAARVYNEVATLCYDAKASESLRAMQHVFRDAEEYAPSSSHIQRALACAGRRTTR